MSRVWGGIVPMDAARYDAVAAALPVPLIERRAVCVPTSECTGAEQAAVYVAVTAGGYACYVGQTRRPADRSGAAARRLRDHMCEPSKAAEWAGYWVFPLAGSVSRVALDNAESAAAAVLGLPVRNRRWRSTQAQLYR